MQIKRDIINYFDREVRFYYESYSMYVKFSVLPSINQIIRISKKLWDSDFTAIYLLHTDFIYVWRFLRLYVLTLVRLQ